VILISPPAEIPGSYGDEGVMLGVLGFAHSHRRRPVLYERRASYWASHLGLAGARGLPTWGLRVHATAARVAARRLSADLLVPGTDSLDGTYSQQRQLDRIALARTIAARGGRARFVGFSWERSDERIIEALRSVPDARFAVRDEPSLQRFVADTNLGEQTTLGGDLAYLVNASVTPAPGLVDWVQQWRDRGLAVVTVTPNGLWTRHDDGQLRVLSEAIRKLSADVAFVLVPHDSRPTQSDLNAAHSVAAALSGSVAQAKTCVFPARGFAEARAAIGLAELHVAGRMHSAISAWSQGRPALVYGYQHKALGQAQAVCQPDALLAPESSSDLIAEKTTEMLREAPERARRVTEAVKIVRARAAESIQDLMVKS
jgi:polysaccharide pyruvyl transferase WcaK-like protein